MSRRSVVALFALFIGLALSAAACGSSSGASSYGSPKAPVSTDAASSVDPASTAVKIAQSGLGPIVVDGDGRTLYVFTQDTGSTSTCSGGCATAWPPLDGPATAGSGVTGEVGVTTRSDGTQQVTLAGHPLYRYATDAAAGDTTGQAVGGKWYVIDASGKAVTSTASAGQTGY
jgi:predicted lipoprotein with Yx(FWY)xxD motif